MPELPEVETLCRQLREVIVDRQILSSRVIDLKLEHLPPLAGKTVRSVSRHGKQMVWTLSDGMCLVFQLRMTGRFFWLEDGRNACPMRGWSLLSGAAASFSPTPGALPRLSSAALPCRAPCRTASRSWTRRAL